MLSAYADQPFADYVSIKYNGKEIKEGDFVIVDHYNAAAFQYEGELEITVKGQPSEAILGINGYFTNLPTRAEWISDKVAWGTPQICQASGQCFSSTDTEWCNTNSYQLPGMNDVLSFHLVGEQNPNIDINDPSTWGKVPPSKTGVYLVVFTPFVDGMDDIEPLTFSIVAGPDAAYVEGVEIDNDAPAVYYDLMGRKVVNPVKGQLVIESRGGKAIKKVM